MGTRGPMPKRSEDRTRTNKTGEDGVALKKGHALPISFPAADKSWPPEVKKLYASFKKSGMKEFWQQTDIQWLWTACQEYADYRNSSRRSAMHLTAVLSMFNDGLGLTEGHRRRMKIELELPEPEQEDEVAAKRAEMESRLKS